MSTASPIPWLPQLVSLTGTEQDNLAQLHQIFVTDFVRGRPSFLGLPVEWRRAPAPGTGYEDGFLHIVTRDDPRKGVRTFDRLRAERLSWCAAVLAHVGDPAIKVWDYRKDRRLVRTYAWLEDHDYVVDMQKRTINGRRVAFLITAYHVDGPRSRRQLQLSYDRRIR